MDSRAEQIKPDPGYYWVKETNVSEWVIGYYDSLFSMWRISGPGTCHSIRNVLVIGPRISAVRHTPLYEEVVEPVE